jgi:hypothetical protein
MRRLLTGLLLALLGQVSGHAGWTRPYFAATKPGSWSTSRLTSTISDHDTYSYRADVRLLDAGFRK